MNKLTAKIPLLINAAKPKLQEFNRFARVELYPPTPADIPQIIGGFTNLIRGARSGKWKQLTVKEGFVNALITVEVLCWFYVGEAIGKRQLIGYDV